MSDKEIIDYIEFDISYYPLFDLAKSFGNSDILEFVWPKKFDDLTIYLNSISKAVSDGNKPIIKVDWETLDLLHCAIKNFDIALSKDNTIDKWFDYYDWDLKLNNSFEITKRNISRFLDNYDNLKNLFKPLHSHFDNLKKEFNVLFNHNKKSEVNERVSWENAWKEIYGKEELRKKNGYKFDDIIKKGEKTMENNEKKKAMWVTVPERNVHEFTTVFTVDKEGKTLPEPITKKSYAVNVPTKDGKSMSFFVNAKVQHPQVKNYVIIPINEGEKAVTYSHLEKDENGKNNYVKEEPVVKLSQTHLAEIVKEAFSRINDESTKYLVLPKSLIHEDTSKTGNNEYKYLTLPDYMLEYKGHMLAGATMLLPYQYAYEYTKNEDLAVIKLDDNAKYTLWPHGVYDNKTAFELTGKELITINKNNYKEVKNAEAEANKNDPKNMDSQDREKIYEEHIKKVMEQSKAQSNEKSDEEEAREKLSKAQKEKSDNTKGSLDKDNAKNVNDSKEDNSNAGRD